MKNKPKKTQKSYLYIIFLVLAFIILLGTGAYAYYQTTITGTISGNVSKWSFKTNNQTSTFNIDFGSLYPGKTSEHAIELSAEDSELPVVFELIFHWPEIEGAEDLIDFILSDRLLVLNGRTYIDQVDSNYELRGILGLKGYIMPGAKLNIPLNYYWPYYENGQVDNDINPELFGENLTMPVTIVGRQMDKSNVEGFYNSVIFSDLLGLNSECTNGTYAYPNKYGVPCDFVTVSSFPDYEPRFESSETINFTLDDGATEEVPLYLAYPIAGTAITQQN